MYWTHLGWSRPSFVSIAAMLSAVACGPRMVWAGLPGIMRVRMNVNVTTISRVGIACRTRFRIVFSTWFTTVVVFAVEGQ